jgi:adenylate cyclase
VNARLKSFFDDHGFALAAPLVALLIVGLLQPTGWAQRLENLTLSLRFHLRAPWDPPADARLLLVGIDQQSLNMLGAWPWPRTVEAAFLQAVADSGENPRTLAFDLLFVDSVDPQHDSTQAGKANPDAILAQAAGELPSVITGAQSFRLSPDDPDRAQAEAASEQALSSPGPTQALSHIVGDVPKIGGASVAMLPVAPLRQQSLFGFVDDIASSLDGVHYVLPMVVRIGTAVYPSLALQTLGQILHVDPDGITVRVGDAIVLRNHDGKTWTIPVNDKGEMRINYRNAAGFQTVNFGRLFEALTEHVENGKPIPPECEINKKAVLIGQVADGAAATDIGPTPLQARAPLVYTHFNAINDVLRGDYIKAFSWEWIVAAYLAVTWLSLFGLRNASIVTGVAVPTAVIILYAALAVALFWAWSVEIPMVWPMVAYYGVQVGRTIRLWLAEARSREQIKGVFARMLSPEVMNHVLEHPGALEMGGTKRAVTILFSDIRDYTRISEGIEEEELVRQLNAYFSEMVDCVLRNRGTLHKFIGDAVMAVWGDIASSSQGIEADARAAVAAALDMRERLVALNILRTADGLLPLRIGIGLNHGEVLAGQIGAAQRSEFTVIGDAVNAASRLEGMTKEFHTDLAIGESVAELLDDSFLVRRLGRIQLKGKKKPLMVFEVLGRRSQRDTAWSDDDLALYHDAFDRFLARDFAPAADRFEQCAQRHPKDSCVRRYLAAAREFHVTPPTEDWDGRVVMETK